LNQRKRVKKANDTIWAKTHLKTFHKEVLIWRRQMWLTK